MTVFGAHIPTTVIPQKDEENSSEKPEHKLVTTGTVNSIY